MWGLPSLLYCFDINRKTERERDAAIKFGFELRSWIEREATKGNVLSSQLYCQRCLISSIDEFNMIILNIYGYVLQKVFITNIVL